MNLVYLAEHFGLKEVADFWEGVVNLNKWHQHRISKLIIKKLFGSVYGKKICILGFAFKANTNDTRESAAINICKDLLEEGALLFINDPKVNPEKISRDLEKVENLSLENLDLISSEYGGEWCFAENITKHFKDADAAVILTEWQEFADIDWESVSKTMRKPAWIFDSRSLLSSDYEFDSNVKLWR